MGTSQPHGQANDRDSFNDPDAYDKRTIHLHWLTSALVAALWILAQLIDDFPRGMPRISARSTHIVVGFVLAIIVFRRIRWRLHSGRRLPSVGPQWLASAAKATHGLLYFGLVSVLLLGITNAWTRGDTLFRLITIPKLLPEHQQLKPAVETLHMYFANGLLILAALHALAALVHHFYLKDRVLRRMLGR